MSRMREVLDEGIDAGELIAAEQSQIRYAALGANVLYFLAAPMMRLIEGTDPLEPEALELRRRAAIEFLGQALFIDREHGARVAARVLASAPMPQANERLQPFHCPSIEGLAQSHPGRKIKNAARVGHPGSNEMEHRGRNETESKNGSGSSGKIENRNAAGSNGVIATDEVRRK
jgi:hypothetical protein